MKLSLDELRERLTDATERWEATNLALQAAIDNDKIDEETVADLESKFEAEGGEVERLRKAIEREEKMVAALKQVPRPEGDVSKVSGDGNGHNKAAASALARVLTEPLTYRPPKEGGQHSFYKDLIFSNRDFSAAARLQRHMKEMAVEMRADLNTTDNTGGEFVPPLHLQAEWAELARAGRPFANLLPNRGAPPAFSFTLPKVNTGVATAVQATQNNAIQETDAATTEITFTVATIAGMQDLSIQSVDFSTPGLDEVITADLAADYATKLDQQLLFGSGSSGQVQGVFGNSNINAVTYTDANPTVPEFYPKLADAIQKILTTRYMAADVIVMHPRRWAWILAALDTTNRPLVTPYAPQNALARFDAVAPENIVGNMQGLTVVVDPNIRTTQGAGTNEDEVLVTRVADHVFYETPVPFVRTFDEVGSGTLTVRIRVHGYIAYTSDRQPKASAKITGTGLVAPTF